MSRNSLSAHSMWSTTTLGELATFVNGMAFKPTDWGATGRPIIRIQNLTGTSGKVNRYDGKVPEKYVVHDGDLLMSWSATIGVFVWQGEDGVLNQHIFKVLPTNCDAGFLRHLLQSMLVELRATTHGSSMTHLTKGRFEATEVLIPPLEEQRRIARLLDEADRLRRLREEANEKAQRILPALFAEMFGDRDTNPKGWQTATLAQVLDGIQTGWSPTCLDEPVDGDEWGVLKLGAVSWNWFDETANKRLPVGVEPRRKLAVSGGDILMSRKNTRELVGASVVVDQIEGSLMFPDLMFRLMPSDTVEALYLWGALQTPSVRDQIRQRASGSAASMCNVSQARLREVSVLLPPLSAQKAFARVASRVFASRRQREDATRRLESACQVLQSRLFG